jgi:hypothetical protein
VSRYDCVLSISYLLLGVMWQHLWHVPVSTAFRVTVYQFLFYFSKFIRKSLTYIVNYS